MGNPRVEVRMSQEFYDALSAFAAEQECSPASVMLRATKALLSKSHKWKCGTRGRPLARTRKGIQEEVSDAL